MVELWWAATGFAAFIVAAPLWWLVPKWQMQSVTAGGPKASLAKADIEDNFRKTIGQASLRTGRGYSPPTTSRSFMN
jgi:hypothetical protein